MLAAPRERSLGSIVGTEKGGRRKEKTGEEERRKGTEK